MEIRIKTIPIEQMRYPSVGDYWYDPQGVLEVRVAEMGNELYHKMVVIHELIEEALTKHRGLSEQDIMAFDLYYEKRREQGLVPADSEPGFDPNAPYLREHTLATSVEMMMCALSGESWTEYDRTVMNL
jgi:hypothetical protein